ncbi:MAG: hypothetical protein ABS35_13165 [Kaistia sp. SCN 65-12]|nr:MAG: hypothetical protein ABS35_13165 [Kaistia sp. SCN 65-12]
MAEKEIYETLNLVRNIVLLFCTIGVYHNICKLKDFAYFLAIWFIELILISGNQLFRVSPEVVCIALFVVVRHPIREIVNANISSGVDGNLKKRGSVNIAKQVKFLLGLQLINHKHIST